MVATIVHVYEDNLMAGSLVHLFDQDELLALRQIRKHTTQEVSATTKDWSHKVRQRAVIFYLHCCEVWTV